MTDSQTWSSELNLSDNEFWAQSPEQRYAAYRTLRALAKLLPFQRSTVVTPA